MPIVQAFTNQAKLDMMGGVHAPTDTYKIALYVDTANLDKNTTAYTATGEVVGTGYTAGGATLTGYARALSGDVAYLNWADPSWASSTITARGALIYNASKTNAAVAVLDFGANVSSSNGTFTVDLPANGATATVRIG